MAVSHRLLPAAVVLVVVALLVPIYLGGLGTPDVTGDDEAREIGIIQDIAERGRWILPRFNDTVFPDKPLLYHWLAAAACVAGGGCSEDLVRLPSAVSALLVIAVVGFAGARLFDLPAGIAATVLLGLCPFFLEHARVARPDILVSLILTAALFVFYRWWQDGCRSQFHASAIGVLFGVAVLAKGPVAPVVGAVTIFTFLALRRQIGRGRALLRARVLIPFSVIGGSWYLAALIGWGGDFARKHLMGRYLGNIFGGDLAFGIQPSHSLVHHLSFYPLHLLLGALPWTPLLVAAVIAIYRDPARRADSRYQFLQIWIASVLVVFSFAAFKVRHYLLPALPAAFMLGSGFAATLGQGWTQTTQASGVAHQLNSQWSPRALMTSIVGTALTVGFVAWWWWLGGPESLSRSDREVVQAIETLARARLGAALLSAVVGVLACSTAMYLILRRRWRTLLGLGIAGTLLWMVTIQPAIRNARAADASLRPFAAAVRQNIPEGASLYFFGPVLRPMVVYWGRPIPNLRRDLSRVGSERSYLIVNEADLASLRQSEREIRTITEHVGRVGNLARSRVLLVEMGSLE